MKKHTGFTLIELLMVLTLMSGVALVSGPSFIHRLEVYRLDESLTNIYDMVLEARNASFAKKVCPDSGKPAVYWGVFFDSPNQQYTLTCRDIDDALDLVETKSVGNANLEIHPVATDDMQDTADINFVTQKMSSDIFFEGSAQFEDDIRITLTKADEQRALCLNAIAAFPNVNQNDNICP